MNPDSENASPLRILVICTGNRARSQMGHGWLSHLGGGRIHVDSAGVTPKTVHPMAVWVMVEVGIDISGHTSDHVGCYVGRDYDLVLTVCDAAREVCPVLPGAKRTVHHGFTDPDQPQLTEAELLGLFRSVPDQIGDYCRCLLNDLGTSADLPHSLGSGCQGDLGPPEFRTPRGL